MVEVQASAQEMRHAVGGKKLNGTGHRALQIVHHPADVPFCKVKLLGANPCGLHFMGKDHLMRIFDKRGKLRLVGYRHQGAVEFGRKPRKCAVEPADASFWCAPFYAFDFAVHGHFKRNAARMGIRRILESREFDSVVPPGFRHGRIVASGQQGPCDQQGESDAVPLTHQRRFLGARA